jgi:hypothetical protein
LSPELLSTLRSAISENDSHEHKIQRAHQGLSGVFPLTVTGFPGLPEETVTLVDQFLYRFTKMQDSLGTRFLPALHSLLEGDDRARPFLDVLNRLEQLGVLTSVETWQLFRTLRNRLAHDYPETIVQTVETLNLLYAEIGTFVQLYRVARAACDDRLPKET